MRTRRLVSLVTVALSSVGFALVFTTSASAHTEVQRASPSPGEVVTGTVDAVELLFLDPVVPPVSIRVRAANGAAVDGLGTVTHTDDGRAASVSFTPLTSAGDYVVDYEFVAIDGDAQTDAYRFTIASGDLDEDENRSFVGPALLVALASGLGVAVVIALRRRSSA